MKRWICFILMIATLLCLSSCSLKKTRNNNFYYVRNEYIHGEKDGVIAVEVRDTTDFTDARVILEEYLKGPQNAKLASPFPERIEIIEYLYKEDSLHITLSAHMVTLSKAKQVLACTCFARTAMELTGVNSVYFQTNNSDFARMDPILIDRDSILLYDEYNSVTTTGRN